MSIQGCHRVAPVPNATQKPVVGGSIDRPLTVPVDEMLVVVLGAMCKGLRVGRGGGRDREGEGAEGAEGEGEGAEGRGGRE